MTEQTMSVSTNKKNVFKKCVYFILFKNTYEKNCVIYQQEQIKNSFIF